MTVSSATLLLAMGLFPGSNPTTSPSNALLQAVGQHDLGGSGCTTSPPRPEHLPYLSCEHSGLAQPLFSVLVPPQGRGRMWPKSKQASPSLLAGLSWVELLARFILWLRQQHG